MIISQTTEINAFNFFYMFLFIVFFGRCTHLNIEVPSEAPNNNRQGKRGKPLQYTSNGIETMSFDARLLSFSYFFAEYSNKMSIFAACSRKRHIFY